MRSRHRDHYTELAAQLDAPAGRDYEQRVEQAETEIDNLRAAFGWSRENSDMEAALALSSSLLPVWHRRGRVREGLSWFDAALAEATAHDVEARVRARALADQAVLSMVSEWVDAAADLGQAQQALVIARELDDPALLGQVLTACCQIAVFANADCPAVFAEAIGLARALDDRWRLSQLLGWQALAAAVVVGNPIVARAAAEEGRDLADAIGDRWTSRQCRFCLATAQLAQGDPKGAAAQFAALVAEAEAAHDVIRRVHSIAYQGLALAWQGDRKRPAPRPTRPSKPRPSWVGLPRAPVSALALAALAAGDIATARHATESAWQHVSDQSASVAAMGRAYYAQAALAGGDLIVARRWADHAVTTTAGLHLVVALTTRARVAIAQGESEYAERNAHDALAIAASVQAYLGISDTLECLAALAGEAASHREAARLFGAAHGLRQVMGVARFKVWDRDYEASVAAVVMPWATKTLTPRGPRARRCPSTKRSLMHNVVAANANGPPAGGDLTPAERDVVRLVSEGLGNNDIATRLFVSPRTVQTHLTHVYSKLGLTSRVQLAQEAARHA